MTLEVKTIEPIDADAWDSYVHAHPSATLYHLSTWKNVIEKTYGHDAYYLMAVNSSKLKAQSSKENRITGNDLSAIRRDSSNSTSPKNSKNPTNSSNSSNSVVGILPLVHLKHFLFGNSLISIPFFDLGGILADNEETEKALLLEAIKLAQDLKVANIELRHTEPLSWLADSSKLKAQSFTPYPLTYEQSAMSDQLPPISYQLSAISYVTKSHKVRMLLELPHSSELLMKSFKAKLRSQIRKPMKEGLTSKVGGVELLDDFYKVFSINMRDLGSPVHSKKLMRNVLEEFADKAKILMVHKDSLPVACSLVVGFKDTLENPWASALREHSRLSPNMLLYWTMLEYACDNGYAYFDFGRCSPDEGTYKFKEQWGAKPEPLYWHYVSFDEQPIDTETSEKSKFDKAIRYWQKLPVSLTKIIGPMIRKHIGL